jgi:protein SCO1
VDYDAKNASNPPYNIILYFSPAGVVMVALHKIIIFVIFVSAALISSLFIYHFNQKPSTPILSDNIGIVFPVPREIKSFKLATANNTLFTEKDFYHHWTLLVFGFTHCASVCPTTLDMLNLAYSKLHTNYPDLRVVLISVDADRDTPQSLMQYVQSFNTSFIGVTGKIQEIRKLQSQLGVYSERLESTDGNYQIEHTSSIMLINPKGQWAGLFKFGLKPNDFIQGFEKAVKG